MHTGKQNQICLKQLVARRCHLESLGESKQSNARGNRAQDTSWDAQHY